MIIIFPVLRTRRAAPMAFNPATERVTAGRSARLVCRWVAGPAGGNLHAVWEYPATEEAPAVRKADPGRLRLVA